MNSYPGNPREYVIASYRYLRLSIVVLVATLGMSLLIERSKASCMQGSISAYYYTPVHAVFVGALVAMGVVMVALKGRDPIEDLCFNLAGVLAPVVAFVPTARPSTICSRPGDEVAIGTAALVSNNVPALLVGAGLAIVVAYGIAQRQGKVRVREQIRRVPRPTAVGIALSAVALGVGVAWYLLDIDSFVQRAHGVAAVAMFTAIWCAVLLNAGWPSGVIAWVYQRLGADAPAPLGPRQATYRQWYRGLSLLMAGAAVAAGISLLWEWDQRVFWLEAAQITAFALFWLLQTFESWEYGIEPPPTATAA
jgi:hypothetical protein